MKLRLKLELFKYCRQRCRKRSRRQLLRRRQLFGGRQLGMHSPMDDAAGDDWVEEVLAFGKFSIRLKHLRGNDNWSMPRMGLHVWPGARRLCEDMALRSSTVYEHHRSMLILGGGTGLEGLVNAAVCGHAGYERIVCLTDGAAMSCELMRENVALNAPAPAGTTLHVNRLRFGESDDHAKLPMLTGWDCVAISDSTFDYDLVPSVLRTVAFLQPAALIVCSITGGAPAFERFTDGVYALGFKLVDPAQLPAEPTSRAARTVVLRFERTTAARTMGVEMAAAASTATKAEGGEDGNVQFDQV